jgi:hypothetical protein
MLQDVTPITVNARRCGENFAGGRTVTAEKGASKGKMDLSGDGPVEWEVMFSNFIRVTLSR